MTHKRSRLLPTPDNKLSQMELLAVTREQEHEWRELLQKQLADHWLKLNYPEEIKPKNVILEKSAVQERKLPEKNRDRPVDLVGLR